MDSGVDALVLLFVPTETGSHFAVAEEDEQQ